MVAPKFISVHLFYSVMLSFWAAAHKEAYMKAVIFDLFETLVTEWGRPKYTSRQVALDLVVDHHVFQKEWFA